jgi:hypothetical protein
MSKPHKHAELIKAWADGAEIQEYILTMGADCEFGWTDTINPTWKQETEYRIKPREFDVGRYYPAINKYGQECLIKCTSRECKPTFRDKHEFYSEPYYRWIGEKLEIDWPEEAE